MNHALHSKCHQKVKWTPNTGQWVKLANWSAELRARMAQKEELPTGAPELRRWTDPDEPRISVTRQCALLGLPRRRYYYSPAAASEEDLMLMRRIDAQHLRTPFYGSRRMALHLEEEGFPINRKRIQRLMRLIGIEAIHPRKTTVPAPSRKVYPYPWEPSFNYWREPDCCHGCPRMAFKYLAADRMIAALPSHSITMSQNAPWTRSNSNGSTALMMRSTAEADSGT